MTSAANPTPKPSSIAQVVADGMCLGCGLCSAVTAGEVAMKLTASGSVRPTPTDQFTNEQEDILLAACPGLVADARPEPSWNHQPDPIWGLHGTMAYAWAGDAGVRHRGATGGALTALGSYVLDAGVAKFVLHVGADPDRPMHSRWIHSETAQQVQANTGSRYGPTAPLAGLTSALDRQVPFTVIAKPCDLGAIHRLSLVDPRVDQFCIARFTLVCGGQSKLTKSRELLEQWGVNEQEVSLFRYRGYGNPGPTAVETSDGRRFTTSYQELWEDESSWNLETRCKLCPDALGETADIAAADVWPGGAPSGEDEGFNGVVVRSARGEEILAGAVASGHLVLGQPITPREFDDFQPHQVRKKEALAARYRGMADAGVPPIATTGLRVEELGKRLDPAVAQQQQAGTARRLEKERPT